MLATVAVTLDTYTASDPDRMGVTEPDYTTTSGLFAYWLVSADRTDDPVTGGYTETAQLAVPSTFPAVKPQDKLTVDNRVWDIDGHPTDYSLGPFTEQWINLTGEKPVTVIHLRRTVNVTIEEGS